MDIACTSKTLATLFTSTGCKDPRTESTLTMNQCERPKSLIALCQQYVSVEQKNYCVYELETIWDEVGVSCFKFLSLEIV
jgi:hypothetical protein